MHNLERIALLHNGLQFMERLKLWLFVIEKHHSSLCSHILRFMERLKLPLAEKHCSCLCSHIFFNVM
ncbi:hypothetical protein RchiOBHm_Chr6g0280391 [Rosa chinensis]|uniref:Uncharacterized protein n=1 Tax=Rosa chinensis TaxID=74649 RepID=A0A2P6PT88_ROSCH|nr:hypothetical protein RchiOBHm_Chr6g0280391 [Rosa chinensis]